MPRCGQIRALLEQNRPAPLIAVKDLPAGLAARRSHARYVFGSTSRQRTPQSLRVWVPESRREEILWIRVNGMTPSSRA